MALTKGDFAFVLASMFCVVAEVVISASTVISNCAIGKNTVVRDIVVRGRLVTNDFTSESDGAQVWISNRAEALNNANAPLDELFDFLPGDDSQWTYKPNQWNNAWKRSCESESFSKHEAIELEVYSTLFLISGTTFLPGPLSTDSSKALPTPDSIQTKIHEMVLERGVIES